MGANRTIFAIMILVYHQNDERGTSAVDGTVAAFVDCYSIVGLRVSQSYGVIVRQP